MSTRKSGLSAAGAVVAALLASVCCVGPIALAVAGLGGAASALLLAPYRPYLLGLSFGLLGVAFFFAYRRPRAGCDPGERCVSAPSGRGGKMLLWLATFVVVLVSLSSPRAGWRPLPSKTPGGSAPTNTILTVRGMTCGGCVARVEQRLGGVPGVVGYEVSLQKDEARVSYDPAATTPAAIAAAVSETGFAASVSERPAP